MRLIIMFVAMAVAAVAFFVMMHITSKEPDHGVVVPPQVVVEKIPETQIYVARQDIPIGATIEQNMLDIQPWPSYLVLPDMIKADNPNQPSAEITIMIARTPFTKGEPLILNRLGNEKDPGFLAASLPKGMRSVTIASDAVSGVAGFIFPGDRVDVLITHDVALTKASPKPDGTMPPEKKDAITEVLLSNIRVMAVNQKSVSHGGEPPTVPTTVTLEVTSGDAQKLRLAESGNGRLSLALRSLKDKDELSLARPTGVDDLSRLTPPSYFPFLYDGSNPIGITSAKHAEDDNKLMVTVVRGVKAEPVEVSRP